MPWAFAGTNLDEPTALKNMPWLPTQGKTRDEALANIKEAIQGWLKVIESMRESGQVGGREVVMIFRGF